MPKGAEKIIQDHQLSRYACCQIVMSGDPRKPRIALCQTYFAMKTRQQDPVENYDELSEVQKRLTIRAEMKRHNIIPRNTNRRVASLMISLNQKIIHLLKVNFGREGQVHRWHRLLLGMYHFIFNALQNN